MYAKSRFHFMIKPMNVVDLVAILPFYVELLVAAFVDGERGDASALVCSYCTSLRHICTDGVYCLPSAWY